MDEQSLYTTGTRVTYSPDPIRHPERTYAGTVAMDAPSNAPETMVTFDADGITYACLFERLRVI